MYFFSYPYWIVGLGLGLGIISNQAFASDPNTDLKRELTIQSSNSNPGFSTEHLPELGDSADRYLSPNKAHQIGRHLIHTLRQKFTFLDDPEINHYLNNLGTTLGNYAQLRDIGLIFNIIAKSDMNAFAIPGGYITLNSGLILATDDESELASVISHEIAHLAQRHLPRIIARAQQNKIPATAAIIASILLGGPAGLAGLTATNAALISAQLRYSREFEHEADNIGIQILAAAGFDPSAMGRFFGKLERNSQVQGSDIPEFLLTHPSSYKRISEAQSRAQKFKVAPISDSFQYLHMRAKIRALYTPRHHLPLDYFTDRIKTHNGLQQDAARYGYALTLMQTGNYQNARQQLAILLKKSSVLTYLIVAAEIDAAAGDETLAIQKYQQLIKQFPDHTYLRLYLATVLLSAEQPTQAKRVLRTQLRRFPEDYRAYPLLSRAYGELGQLAESHQSLAEYHIAIGDLTSAAASLERALEVKSISTYLKNSLTSRLREIEEAIHRI